ncbi:hypothetical protein CIPAW_15G041300 [Carya illinoinensis]|uniref:Uncharacterized protein n=1 Tax=Carya illinoinensis TaxID=32201 RepID=A0A8T1N7T7_CARIL|nr:hypothetical protein CIPAW_15G041300 [Carya illinoinensis]
MSERFFSFEDGKGMGHHSSLLPIFPLCGFNVFRFCHQSPVIYRLPPFAKKDAYGRCKMDPSICILELIQISDFSHFPASKRQQHVREERLHLKISSQDAITCNLQSKTKSRLNKSVIGKDLYRVLQNEPYYNTVRY